MNMRRVLIGTVVVGIVANAIDYVLWTYIIGGWWTSLPFANDDPQMMWMIIGDFGAAFMLMWAWDKMGAVWGKGPANGFKFGLGIGALISFPSMLFWQASIVGFPYSLAWKYIFISVVWYGILGAVAAMLDGKEA